MFFICLSCRYEAGASRRLAYLSTLALFRYTKIVSLLTIKSEILVSYQFIRLTFYCSISVIVLVHFCFYSHDASDRFLCLIF